MTNVLKSELVVRATAALEEEIKKDLEKEDPQTLEKAKAVINENTTGNDGSRSNTDNYASRGTTS